MVSKLLQYQMEIFFMFFFAHEVDQYVINEYPDKLVQLLHKDLVHQIYKVGWSISQSKRQHCILVQTIHRNEGRLRNVTFSYIQLILSQ
jgi:hypothetical protein